MLEIISVHIAKTAGSAFRRVLAQVYSTENVLWDYPPEDYQPQDDYQLGQPLPNHIRAIHGHFPASKYCHFFPDAKRIIWFRHPIFRLISEYFFVEHFFKFRNPGCSFQMDLLAFAQQDSVRNFQAKHISDFSLNDFYFVGIQEFYNDDLSELQTLMAWKNFVGIVENINPNTSYHNRFLEILNDQSLIHQLAALNEKDMELYEEALKLRAARRHESLILQHTIVGLQQSKSTITYLQEKLRQSEFWQQQASQGERVLYTKTNKSPQVSDLLLGFCIDSPAPIEERRAVEDELLISGWVIGRQVKANSLKILHKGQILKEVSINKYRPDVARVHPVTEAVESGFLTTIDLGGMPESVVLELQVQCADRTDIAIGWIQSSSS